VQYADNFSTNSRWIDRALLQVHTTNLIWTDPSPFTTGRRFYRAVVVPAPVEKNLVFIEPGTFVMGSPPAETDWNSDEGPQTSVTISSGFWMGKYLVTRREFLSIMGTKSSWSVSTDGISDDLTLPVDSGSSLTTGDEAAHYCALLTTREVAAGRTSLSATMF